jgi:hypothetical protein
MPNVQLYWQHKYKDKGLTNKRIKEKIMPGQKWKGDNIIKMSDYNEVTNNDFDFTK